ERITRSPLSSLNCVNEIVRDCETAARLASAVMTIRTVVPKNRFIGSQVYSAGIRFSNGEHESEGRLARAALRSRCVRSHSSSLQLPPGFRIRKRALKRKLIELRYFFVELLSVGRVA